MNYSIVIPIYNEEGSLPNLFSEILSVMNQLPGQSEIICVNDGSSDGSEKLINSQCKNDPRFNKVHFSQNYGQSAAMWAGAQKASGDVLIFLDADGQNNPADILSMLPHIDTCDAVIGWRKNRQDTPAKKFSSRIANFIRNRITREAIRDTGCTLKIIKYPLYKNLPAFNGMHRFLPTLLKMQGARLVEVPVSHRPRISGCSKYGLGKRAWLGFFDLFGVRWLKNRYFSPELIQNISSKERP